MSTESPRNLTDLATQPAAEPISVRADEAAARAVVRATATEAHPYSSFEQGGIRRFDRTPFGRGPFDGHSDLPPFRIS